MGDKDETRNRPCKVEKWTDISKLCYKRKCKCKGCYYNKYLDSKCQMKYSVIKLIKVFGIPKEGE